MESRTPLDRFGEHLRFAGEFLRRPVSTGAIAPSSHWLADLMVEDMGLERADTIVELGPGTGAFTRVIARQAPAAALVLAVEANPGLAQELQPRFPRVRIVNESAEHLPALLADAGRSHADAIVSGLPWAMFSRELQDRLLQAVVTALRPGGRFATFTYLHASWMPPGRRFRKMLVSSFREVAFTRIEWRNLPPAFVYRCEK
jgi:phospholipid N-methyltransferase